MPNYIFPFMSLAFFSVSNISDLQQLMYRPLYWFGNGSNPTLNPSLSLASNPAYSKGNTVVSFTIKPYKFSNGETVTAQDVVFWMNMLKVEYLGWAAYAPGGMPDDVKSVVANSPTKVTITLTGPTNPYWFTYNELSQITPFPMAWDIAATGQEVRERGLRNRDVRVGDDEEEREGHRRHAGLRGGEVVRSRLLLPLEGVRLRPGEPEGAEQLAEDVRDEPALAGRRRPVAPDLVQLVGLRRDGPEQDLLGPGQAEARLVRRSCRSPRAPPSSTRSSAARSPSATCPSEDITSPAKSPLVPGKNNPRLVELQARPVVLVGLQLLPLQLQLDR